MLLKTLRLDPHGWSASIKAGGARRESIQGKEQKGRAIAAGLEKHRIEGESCRHFYRKLYNLSKG